MRLNLRQFKYFVAVAEELHFTRAAARLNIGQPPLSLQIQAIERELGVLLLNRTHRKVELTPAGEIFLQEARQTLLQAEHAVNVAARAAKGEMGTIKLSFVTSLPLIKVFTETIRSFRLQNPDIHLELKISSSKEIIEEVLIGTVDVGFTRPPASTVLPSSLKAMPVYEDNLMAVLPIDHPLNARSGPIAIEELKDEKFVLRPRGSGVGFYEQVFQICAKAGFSPQIVQEAIEATTTQGLVAAGVGITIAPQALKSINAHGVTWREIANANVNSKVQLIHSPNNPNPILDQLLEKFSPIE